MAKKVKIYDIAAIRDKATYRVRPPKQIKMDANVAKIGRPPRLFDNIKRSKVATTFLKFFLLPLVNAMELGEDPDDMMPLNDRVRFIFGALHRDVVMCVAKNEFKMPGYSWAEGTPNILRPPLLTDAKIKQGTTLMVRIDDRSPDRIDIERCDVIGGTEVVFLLTASEYRSILPHLQEIAGCNDKLQLTVKPTFR